MEPIENIMAAHQGLSNLNLKFLQFSVNNPRMRERSEFRTLFSLNQNDVRMQPWPAFINQHIRKELIEAGVGVFALIRSIPQRLFNNNPEKISEYFRIPLEEVNVYLTGLNTGYLSSLLTRGDFVLSQSGLKCIEYNTSAFFGGWDIDFYREAYRKVPILSEFFQAHNVKISNKNLLDILLGHLVNRAVEAFDDLSGEINMAFSFWEDFSLEAMEVEKNFNQVFQNVLNTRFNGLSGYISFCPISQLEEKQNFLYYGGKRQHVLIQPSGAPIPQKVLDIFAAGNINLYNGPIAPFLGNKLHLALLSEHEDSDFFTPTERETIKKYIPWTRKIDDQMKDFILTSQDELVIKPPMELGGKDVLIGSNSSRESWQEALSRALEQGNWVVQKYCESFIYMFQRGISGFTTHKAVWGAFIFGSSYGGAWLRVLPQEETTGVINRHQGAEECAVFEVEE